jgi:hypothetical protein
MPNSPESQDNSRFKPLKGGDIYNDCVKARGLAVNLEEFLGILITLGVAGYDIASHKQIDEMIQMLNRPAKELIRRCYGND